MRARGDQELDSVTIDVDKVVIWDDMVYLSFSPGSRDVVLRL